MSATQSRGLDKESETLSYRLVAERFAFEITVLNLHPALKSVIPCHHKRIAECFRLDAKLPQTGAQILDNLHIVVALRDGQFHFISIRRDQQRKRLHSTRQDCAVIEYIRTAAFRQGEPADIGNEKAAQNQS